MASVVKSESSLRLTFPEVAGLDLSGLPGELPDVRDLIASGQFIGPELESTWSSASATLWQKGSQQLAAVIGFRLGVTLPPAISAIRDIVRTRTIDLVVDAVSRAGIDAMLKAGIQAASSVLSAAPVIGAIVQVLWGFGKLAKQGIEDGRTYGVFDETENAPAPLALSPAADKQIYDREILARMTNTVVRDWTDIWLPRGVGVGDAANVREPFAARYLRNGTYRIQTTAPQPGWTGCLPGTDSIHRGLEGHKELGQLLPTVQTEGATLWGVVTNNGPSQYTVHAPALVRYWQEYLLSFREWLQSQADGTGKRHIPASLAASLIDSFSEGSTHAKLRGWHFWRKQRDAPDAGPEGAGGPWGIQHATPVRQARWVAQAQRANLGTATVAYVDESFAAIARDPVLASVWESNRRALLEHPSRAGIDPGNVPDPAYRDALIASLRSAPPAAGLGLGSGPPLDPGAGKAKPPVFNLPGGGDGGSAALVGLAIAGAGLAIVGSRLVRR